MKKAFKKLTIFALLFTCNGLFSSEKNDLNDGWNIVKQDENGNHFAESTEKTNTNTENNEEAGFFSTATTAVVTATTEFCILATTSIQECLAVATKKND